MHVECYRRRVLSLFLLLVCLYFLPFFKNAFTLPKELLLLQAAALLLFIPLISAAAGRGTFLALKPGLLPLVLIVILFLVSLAYTPSPHVAAGEILTWLSYLVIFFSASQVTGRDINGIVLASLLGGAVMGGIAILQYFFIDPLPLAGGQYRIYSTLGNPNHVGGYLAIVIPAGMGLVIFSGARSRKLLVTVFIALAVCGAALLASRSRGAMLGAGVGVLALIAAAAGRRVRSAGRLIAAALVLAVVAVLVTATLTMKEARPGKDSVQWRLLAWRGITEMIKEKPVTGWGAGSLNLVYLDFQAKVLDGTDDAGTRISATGILKMAHNEYLQLAAEEGVPAAILFIILVAACAWSAFRGGPAGAGPGAAVVSFATLSLTGFPLRFAATGFLFFVLAGICLSFQRTSKRVELRAKGKKERLCLALAAILLLALTIKYSINRLSAEELFTRGIRAYNRDMPGTALRFFEQALEREPHNGVARFYMGSCLSKMKRYEEAKTAIRESQKTHLEMNSILEMGNLNAVTGKTDEAVRLLRKCTRIVPEDPRPRFCLGYAYFRKGDFQGAADEYREVLRLDGDYPDARKNLGLAVAAMGRRKTTDEGRGDE